MTDSNPKSRTLGLAYNDFSKAKEKESDQDKAEELYKKRLARLRQMQGEKVLSAAGSSRRYAPHDDGEIGGEVLSMGRSFDSAQDDGEKGGQMQVKNGIIRSFFHSLITLINAIRRGAPCGYPDNRATTRVAPTIILLILFVSGLFTAVQAQPGTMLTGVVRSAADGRPIPDATVSIMGTDRNTRTNSKGQFSLPPASANGTVQVSFIGYRTTAVSFDFGTKAPLLIELQEDLSSLDEVQVIGYGTVSKRFNTGSVVTVKAEDIERQPVANPIAALAGQVPGMTVTQSNGNPGGAFNIQIRGQNSIQQGSEPLIIINGVPYPNGSISNVLGLANEGQSPMNTINPADIESIEVLKDADATAIYGSRGANGVVLITTKKGKAGKTKIDISAQHGIGKVVNKLELLNTQQYVAMRKEAFANDNRAITALTAPDLELWDTVRYTDWQEYLRGKSAQFTNINGNISGGSAQTQFMLSGNYNRSGAVYPGKYADTRGTTNLTITHASTDSRLRILFTGGYAANKNELPGTSMSQAIFLPPNAPPIFDGEGNLNWEENGGVFANPMMYLKRKAHETIDRFLGNMNVQYDVGRGFAVRVTGGYSFLLNGQMEATPLASIDPATANYISRSDRATTMGKNWIIEPQLTYVRQWSNSTLEGLIGATAQHDTKSFQTINGTGFANDAVIEAMAFAQNVQATTSEAEYRYQAAFGRINYNYAGRYIVNLTARRDGSSRFGPGRRVSNFGAIGAAWLFSEELKTNANLQWLSFGKIRGSLGVTGNDQIGDYQFLDDYRAVSHVFQGVVGYMPSRLYNEDYSWERNVKLEGAVELGFLQNRIMLTANYFRNRSDSQLINYRLPSQTGFTSILRNFDALVENNGWEFLLSGKPMVRHDFSWDVSANVTIARNKLLDFPNLESSSYGTRLVIGEPITVQRYLNYTGLDAEEGIYTFDGTSRPTDQTEIADFTPAYYGGINNSMRYKDWSFSFLLQFTKQQAPNHYATMSGRTAGMMHNMMRSLYENRWQNPGDESEIQRLTSNTGPVNTGHSNFVLYSNAIVADASFIRLKNVHLSYSIPLQFVRRIGVTGCRIFFQAQNLWTLTAYQGLDPETGAFSTPPQRVSTFGINLSL